MGKNKFRIQIDPQALVPEIKVRRFYLLAGGVELLIGGVIAISYQHLPHTVPLFFTEPWGEARLAPKAWLYFLPCLGVAVGVINLTVGKLIGKERELLSYTLAVGTVVVAIMLGVSLGGILRSLL